MICRKEADSTENEKESTPQMAMTQKKPPQIPARTGILPLNPARPPVVRARMLLGPGVMAVMKVNTKKAESTDAGMCPSVAFWDDCRICDPIPYRAKRHLCRVR